MTSNYDAVFTGEDRAPWASLCAYLLHQLRNRHHSLDGPTGVGRAAWRGLEFLKHEQYQAVDLMTCALPSWEPTILSPDIVLRWARALVRTVDL